MLLRRALLTAAVLTLAVTASACAPQRSTPTPAPTTTASATATPTATPTPTPTLAGEALKIDCADLVSDDAIYEWGNGNWASNPDFAVAAGTPAAQAVAHRGTACGWINLTSNETMTVTVAVLAPDELATLKSGVASTSSPVTGYGADAYFALNGGIGTINVFSGKYWLSATSTSFFEAGDAQPIASVALDAVD